MRIENDYYLIVDVEATCCNDGTFPRQEMEIIEIGAVMQDAATFEVISEFQSMIRPVRNPVLTSFCVELTGIRQEDVDQAPGFCDALKGFQEWMYKVDNALFCSWGDYDRNQFQQDCAYHSVGYPFRSGHLNLKTEFTRSLGLSKKFGIDGAVKQLGLQFEGAHHRGLDDARNIARIVRRVCTGA